MFSVSLPTLFSFLKITVLVLSFEHFTIVSNSVGLTFSVLLDVFGPLIGDHMKKLHGSDTHTGKTYTKEKMQPETKQEQEQQDIEALKLRLKEAVMLENFEAAAKYRDEIKALQAKEEHNA